jgi:hypothetical protein
MLEKDILQNSDKIQDGVFFSSFLKFSSSAAGVLNFRVFKKLLQNLIYYVDYMAMNKS